MDPCGVGIRSYAGAVPHTPTPEAPRGGAVYGVDERAEIGRELATIRKARGISQRALEEASSVPQGKISRIERGATYPTTRELDHLATALKLRLHLVILDDEE